LPHDAGVDTSGCGRVISDRLRLGSRTAPVCDLVVFVPMAVVPTRLLTAPGACL